MIKDTKEGQTHFYNDGCGDPKHNDELDRIDIFIIREVGGKLTKKQIKNIRRLFKNVY